MYLPERKEAFLNTLTVSDSVLTNYRRMFDRLAPVEERYGRDFTELTPDEAQEAFELVAGSSVSTAKVAYSLLATYFKWCLVHDYPVTEAILEIDIGTVANYRQSYVCSPAHLLLSMDAVLPYDENRTAMCRYRAYLWLLMMGLTPEEILSLNRNDVDTHLWRIRMHDGRQIPVYTEAIPDIDACVGLEQMTVRSGRTVRAVKRTPAGLLLRFAATDDVGDPDMYTNTISKYVGMAEKRDDIDRLHVCVGLKPTCVRMSGIFYRAFLGEQMGFEPDFDSLVMADFSSKEREKVKYNSQLIARIRRRYTGNYERWKKAFQVTVHDRLPRHRMKDVDRKTSKGTES